jgi:hypothetical protein
VPHSREIRNTADLLTRPFCVQGVLNNVEVLELYQTAVLRNNETLRGLLRILVTFLSHSVREPWFSHCQRCRIATDCQSLNFGSYGIAILSTHFYCTLLLWDRHNSYDKVKRDCHIFTSLGLWECHNRYN